MKKKLIEGTPPVKTKKMGWWTTVQQVKDVLVLNIYQNTILHARHCINVNTHEFMTLRNGAWRNNRLESALGLDPYYGYYYSPTEVMKRFKLSPEDGELVCKLLRRKDYPPRTMKPYDCIEYVEIKVGRDRREMAECRRVAKVNAVMDKIPPLPGNIYEWINQQEIGGQDYATKAEKKNIYACSACGEKFSESKLKPIGSDKIRHNDMALCPGCGKAIKVIKRKKAVDILTHFALIQPIDEDISVVRHFDAVIYCGGGKKQIGLDEAVRIVLNKNATGSYCSLYYNQYARGRGWVMNYEGGVFDNKGNPANRREFPGFLYDNGIEEAFKNTAYERWTRLFGQMAASGVKADYNRLMASRDGQNLMDVIEMLFKGRFRKLLLETSEDISIWSGGYCGILRITGSSIDDVFGIGDRQKINRIRDKNGGTEMVKWMRWSELRNIKISDKVLEWFLANNLGSVDINWASCRMSPEQLMNYIERQRKESYKGKSVKSVISQYEDYMKMCQKLEKDTTDEMVYRPRELKRRHDEAVAELEQREAELKADEYSRRFPEAEKVLKEIKERYEYENDTYMIMVPNRIVEIVAEGRALHHCAGNTDRYFDRIAQRETYICFLRKKAEPQVAYYTIEVEPSGTIRQHRGYLDEEPEIELVKPFLREWQKAIKKRLTENDRKYAAISAVKREQNIEELKAKNNIRVLEGLMEDFMEAVI